MTETPLLISKAASQSEQSDTESQTSSKDASTMTPKSSSKSSVKSKSSKTSLKSKSGSTVSVKNETVPQEVYYTICTPYLQPFHAV